MNAAPRATHELILPAERWARLQEQAAAHGVTAPVAVTAALEHILVRWSHRPERVGTGSRPFSARARQMAGGGSSDDGDAEAPRCSIVATDDQVTVRLPAGQPPLAADARDTFSDLVSRLAEDASAWAEPASGLPLPEAHRRAQARAHGRVATVPDGLLQSAVASTAERHPDRVAVIAGDESLTYAEVVARARRLGRWLRAQEVAPGDLVAIAMDKGPEPVVAMLGILEAGAAWVPVGPDLPDERRAHLLAHTGARLVLTQPDVAPRLGEPDGVTVVVVTAEGPGGDLDAGSLEAAQQPQDPAYVIFTSGSTGTPKGVVVNHRGARNTVVGSTEDWGISGEDRIVALSPLGFDLSVWDVFATLTTGGTLVVPDPAREREPAHWADLVARHGVTVWLSAPALLEMLCDHLERAGDDTLPSLRLVVTGGDWIPLDLPARLRRAVGDQLQVLSAGGATECSIMSISHPAEPVAGWPSIPYGRGLPNQTVHVLDDDLAPRPVGVPGQLYLGGAGVGTGYWRDPERTAEAFVEHPRGGERLYRTGDIARLHGDGTVELLGREDHQVQLRGHRIELGEVETALMTHPAVRTGVVTALAHVERRGVRALVAHVVAEDGATIDADDLRAHLAGLLPGHMVPAHVLVTDALPLTPNGKLDRVTLAGIEPPGASSDTVAPRTRLEGQLAEIWEDVLGAERVGAHDDFFALGGESLVAARLTNQIRDELAIDVGLHAVFSASTLEEFALEVARRRAEQGESLPEALPPVISDPVRAHEPFPLTDQQQAYLLGRGSAFESGNVACHVYVELDGADVDLPRLEQAWQRLIERHGILRAVLDPDSLTQRVQPEVPPYRIAVTDLRDADPDTVVQALVDLRERLSHEVRPVDEWPLFTVAAALLPEGGVRVCLSIDALVTDFRGLRVLFDDWTRAYDDPGATLAPSGLSYRDYVLAAAQLESSELATRSLAYWEDRLATLPAAPDLPMLVDPSKVERPRFVAHPGSLDAERWAAVTARAAERGLTPTALLLAVYSEVLAAWSRTPHFTLNVPSFNRLPLHPEVDDVVGEFASFTLLEVDLSRHEAFELRARRIQEQLWTDLDHSHISGVRILRELMRARGGFDRPFTPVVLTSEVAIKGGRRTVLGGRLAETYGVTQTPQVWMDLLFEERDGELVYSWDVVEQLFPEGMVDAMFAALRELLESLAAEAAWSSHGIVPEPPERAQARGAGPVVARPAIRAHELADGRAASSPDRPAVIAPERTLAHGELRSAAAQAGRWLQRHGVGRDAVVAVVMEKGWEQIVACHAALAAGGAYLPIDPAQPAGRLRRLLERAGPVAALTQAAIDPRVEWPAGLPRLVVDDLQAEDLDGSPPDIRGEPGDLAYVLYTSGSTGDPKAVEIEHGSVVNFVLSTAERWGLGPDDRALAVTALHHDLSVFEVLAVLGCGGSVVIPEATRWRDPHHWADLVERHQVTVWNSVPAMAGMLLDAAGAGPGPGHGPGGVPARAEATVPGLASLRLAIMGGDRVPVTLPGRLSAATGGAQVVSIGGPTETTVWNIWHPVDGIEPGWTSTPYGRAIPNTCYRIVDGRGRDRPDWAVGEMLVSGVSLARGYRDRPDETAAAFVTDRTTGERRYRTGDLGRFRPDGTIEFMGRTDHQVKVRGHRIELGEIEAALSSHPAVRAGVAVAVPGPDGCTYQSLAAHVVAEPGWSGRLEQSGLRAHLVAELPDHMVPASIAEIDQLPLTANGKVDRVRLALPPTEPVAPSEPGSAGAEPGTALEALLARTWAEVLDVEHVGRNDNFFALGGDSLIATRLIVRLRELFEGADVAIQAVFDTLDVAEMAAALVAAEVQPGGLERLAEIHAQVDALTAEEIDTAMAASATSSEESTR